MGVPVPQITEDGLPIVPQEGVQNRTLEQVSVSPVPQTMEAVVRPTPQERLLSRMQECVQNRLRKLFVDVPLPHIMEQTAGKVMRTGKVFTVLHHRDDQACTVDTLGFHSFWRCHGARLHMEVPVLEIAEDTVERPVTRERIIERFGHSITWDSLKPLFLLGYFEGSGKGPLRRRRKRSRTRRRTWSRERSWLRADLQRLRGRDQVRGSMGLASLGPFLGATPWCASTTDHGRCGGDSACACCSGTDRGMPVPQTSRYVEVEQLVRCTSHRCNSWTRLFVPVVVQ